MTVHPTAPSTPPQPGDDASETPTTPQARNAWIKRLAERAGFDLCGIAPAAPVQHAPYLIDWLATGRAGTMFYLHRNLTERIDPQRWLPGAQSIVMVALNYRQPNPADNRSAPDPNTPQGQVAMYAWGRDYHKIVRKKLRPIADAIRRLGGPETTTRICVDTAPLLEREHAVAAGLGWIGKNTLVIHPTLGSTFFLGAIVTNLPIAPDTPQLDHCGSCTRCLDACPTDALPTPYQMDASRCISYLTIEHRGTIDPSLHAPMGDWVFGCDICQDACPFNRKAPPTREPALTVRPPAPRLNLADVLAWTSEQHRDNLRGSPIRRAKPDMLKRNAHIALKNKPQSDPRP